MLRTEGWSPGWAVSILNYCIPPSLHGQLNSCHKMSWAYLQQLTDASLWKTDFLFFSSIAKISKDYIESEDTYPRLMEQEGDDLGNSFLMRLHFSGHEGRVWEACPGYISPDKHCGKKLEWWIRKCPRQCQTTAHYFGFTRVNQRSKPSWRTIT